MRIQIFTVFSLMNTFAFSQYFNSQVKEEFHSYNINKTEQSSYCSQPPSDYPDGIDNDGSVFGDGLCKILEAYITMYQTTGDKAYLHKFIHQSHCILENRHDINTIYAGEADNSEPRWSIDPQMYQDGYIVATFSRFVHLVKILESDLFAEPIYPFGELDPTNYASATCNCNFSGITFTTFGQYANWLHDRCGETLYWFIDHGYWDDELGTKQLPDDDDPNNINQQIGFGRAFLFNGLTAGNTDFLSKAMIMAGLIKGNVDIGDSCLEISTVPVMKLSTDNAYYWSQKGWIIPEYDCVEIDEFGSASFYFNVGDYENYIKYIDDLSHGSVVTWLPRDFYNFQPGTPFTEDDMIRFRNMFTKHIYSGSTGLFNLLVNGANSPIDPTILDGLSDNGGHAGYIRSLSYKPLSQWDGADASTTTPNVYDIVFNYYDNYVGGLSSPPEFYEYADNKSHAEVVEAQWKNECPSLTLYNRDVVYDQDFFSRRFLTVAPQESTGDSYADPIISDPVFVVEPGVTVNMSAYDGVTLKPGTKISGGSAFNARIDQTLCTDGHRPESTTSLENTAQQISDNGAFSGKVTNCFVEIVPNPNNGSFTILGNVPSGNNFEMTICDATGRTVYSGPINPREIFELSRPAGVYFVNLTCENFNSTLQWVVQ